MTPLLLRKMDDLGVTFRRSASQILLLADCLTSAEIRNNGLQRRLH